MAATKMAVLADGMVSETSLALDAYGFLLYARNRPWDFSGLGKPGLRNTFLQGELRRRLAVIAAGFPDPRKASPKRPVFVQGS